MANCFTALEQRFADFKRENTSNATQTVEVTNPPPVATITAPASGFIIGVGQPVAFAGSFTDNTGDVHTVTWSADAITFAGTVNETARTTSGSFTFSAAGVYSIKMTVRDQCNQTSVATGLPVFWLGLYSGAALLEISTRIRWPGWKLWAMSKSSIR